MTPEEVGRIAYPVRIVRDPDEPTIGLVHFPDFGEDADATVQWDTPDAMLKSCALPLGDAYYTATMNGHTAPKPSSLAKKVRTTSRVVDIATCNYPLFVRECVRVKTFW